MLRTDTAEQVVTNRVRGRMLTPTAAKLQARELPPLVSDEPPSRGGENRGYTLLELVLDVFCVCTNVSTARMASKIRFDYSDLESVAEGELDTRGRKGLADVPVHYRAVRLRIRIATEEDDARLARLERLVAHYCPVDSLIRAAVPDYTVTWERM